MYILLLLKCMVVYMINCMFSNFIEKYLVRFMEKVLNLKYFSYLKKKYLENFCDCDNYKFVLC